MLQGQIDYCAGVNSTCSCISFHVLLVSSKHLFLCLFLCLFLHSVGLSWCSCCVSTSVLSLSQLSLLRLFTFCWLFYSAGPSCLFWNCSYLAPFLCSSKCLPLLLIYLSNRCRLVNSLSTALEDLAVSFGPALLCYPTFTYFRTQTELLVFIE